MRDGWRSLRPQSLLPSGQGEDKMAEEEEAGGERAFEWFYSYDRRRECLQQVKKKGGEREKLEHEE